MIRELSNGPRKNKAHKRLFFVLDGKISTMFNGNMSLTKSDLSAIRQIVKGEVKIGIDPVKRDLKKLDKKFDDLFNFLDKDVSQVKRRVDYIDGHLGITTSEL